MPVATRLELPDDLIDAYERLAAERGIPFEQLIADNLRKATNGVGSSKPLTLNDEQRQRVERACGTNFSDPAELVRVIENSAALRLDDVTVELPVSLRRRLGTRSVGMEYGDYLAQLVVRLLEVEAGLR